jgi:hypothetical protein
MLTAREFQYTAGKTNFVISALKWVRPKDDGSKMRSGMMSLCFLHGDFLMDVKTT